MYRKKDSVSIKLTARRNGKFELTEKTIKIAQYQRTAIVVTVTQVLSKSPWVLLKFVISTLTESTSPSPCGCNNCLLLNFIAGMIEEGFAFVDNLRDFWMFSRFYINVMNRRIILCRCFLWDIQYVNALLINMFEQFEVCSCKSKSKILKIRYDYLSSVFALSPCI